LAENRGPQDQQHRNLPKPSKNLDVLWFFTVNWVLFQLETISLCITVLMALVTLKVDSLDYITFPSLTQSSSFIFGRNQSFFLNFFSPHQFQGSHSVGQFQILLEGTLDNFVRHGDHFQHYSSQLTSSHGRIVANLPLETLQNHVGHFLGLPASSFSEGHPGPPVLLRLPKCW
jgi:hypothetical protein